jgi:membrane associated rhomboid family serine protease
VLVGLNVAVLGLMVATGVSLLSPTAQNLTAWGANAGPLTAGGQWWRLFTAMFLHVGIIHLAFNMWALWIIGQIVERLLGWTGLSVVYLLAGLAGSLASIAWNPDVVSAGASGAIFGLFGALLGFLLRYRQAIPPAALKSATRSALVFLLYNLAFGAAVPGIDLACHLGGLASGILAGYAIALPPGPAGLPLRPKRHLQVLAGGLGLLLLVGLALPKDRSLQARFQEAGAYETQALGAFREAAARSQTHALDDAGFAAVIEHQVLPPLATFEAQVRVLARDPRANARMMKAVANYTEAREQAFTHFAQALRAHDTAQAQQAMNELAEASRAYQAERRAAKE